MREEPSLIVAQIGIILTALQWLGLAIFCFVAKGLKKESFDDKKRKPIQLVNEQSKLHLLTECVNQLMLVCSELRTMLPSEQKAMIDTSLNEVNDLLTELQQKSFIVDRFERIG